MCSSYFTHLATELVDQILTGGFKMPLLVNLNIKSKQFADFKEVRDSVSVEYKALEEE